MGRYLQEWQGLFSPVRYKLQGVVDVLQFSPNKCRRFQVGVAALLLSVCVGGKAQADVHIGVAAPLSGQFAAFGEQMVAGARQAVADLNADGGVNGETLVLDIVDDGCDTEKAVAVANQLVGRGVAAVVGHFCAQPSLEAARIYSQQSIPMISPSVSDVRLTDERAGEGVFRLSPRDDDQGKVAARYILDHFGKRTIAVIHDQGSYGKGLADQVKGHLNAADVYETLFSPFEPGRVNYGALVSRLKSDGVEVLFVGGYAADVAAITREIRRRNMDTVVIGGEALLLEEFWTLSGGAGSNGEQGENAGEGVLATYYVDPTLFAAAKQLAERMAEEGQPNGRYALMSYAAVEALAGAARIAGSTDFQLLSNALGSLPLPTIFGEVRFDAKGDSDLPGFEVYRWSEGNYLPVNAM